MAIIKGKINGDINIGLYVLCNDNVLIVPKHTVLSFDARGVLKVDVEESIIYNSHFLGIFGCMNNNGILLPTTISEKEKNLFKTIARKYDMNVGFLNARENVLGNLVLCNDKGALISQSLKKYASQIEDVLGVEVAVGKIMDLDIVGSLGYATNKGFAISLYATDEEYAHVKSVLKVDGDIASVNYGSPYVSSGIIANTNGLVAGEQTTPIELGRLAEVFGFV